MKKLILFHTAFIAVLLLVMVAPTWAASNVYWNYNYSTTKVFSTPEAACSDAGAYYGDTGILQHCLNPLYGAPEVCTRYQCDARENGSNVMYVNIDKNTCPVGQVFDSVSRQCVPECPAGTVWNSQTQQCENPCASTKDQVLADRRITGGYAVTICSGNCRYEAQGFAIYLADGTGLADWKGTGEYCTTQPTGTTDRTSTQNASSDCVSNAAGDKLCLNPSAAQPTNCGHVNGEYMCLSSIPPGTCGLMAGGNHICTSDSPPPVDPVTGQPKTLSGQIKQETPASGGTGHVSNTYNYYGGSRTGVDLNKQQQTESLQGIKDALDGQDEQETGTPATMPTIGDGSWWESSYPDGLSGVWSTHQAALQQTALMGWLNSWSFANSGQCPSWQFNFNLGALGDYGSQSLEVPCWLWDVVRAIVLLSALLLARRLVFGG